MKIIGLYGPQRVGKSTVAAEIPNISMYSYRRMSFASTIRDMMQPLLPTEMLTSFSDKEKPIEALGGKSVREAMILLGTAWGRELIHQDIWVNALFNKAEERKYEYIVIDDLRMNNEMEEIKRRGGIIVRLHRTGVVPVQNHITELEWPKWTPDFEVQNNNPVECAREIVLNAVQFFN